jgi:cytochrome P450
VASEIRVPDSFRASSGRDDPTKSTNEAPWFDEDRQAWVLNRYADVVAAFRCPHLFPAGAHPKPRSSLSDQARSRKLRAQTRAALSPEQLRVWRTQLAGVADLLVGNLPAKRRIDLVASFAQPVSLAFAAIVTGIDPGNAEDLCAIARPISDSAADPFDEVLKARSRAATEELRPWFPSGPELLRDSGFVALAHTLPRLLANFWAALLQNCTRWAQMHHQPRGIDRGVEELLRHARLPGILFRTAIQDVELNGALIRSGQHIVLEVHKANRDPDQFSQANEVDLTRHPNQHLAFGAGLHSCVGAGLIRMACVTISAPLLKRFSGAVLDKEIEWRGGTGFQFPASLWVVLQRDGAQTERPRGTSHRLISG